MKGRKKREVMMDDPPGGRSRGWNGDVDFWGRELRRSGGGGGVVFSRDNLVFLSLLKSEMI